MDDLTLLRRLRDDVAEPDAARLAPAYRKLETAMRAAEKTSASRAPRRRHPVRWAAVGLTAAAAVAAAVVVGGVLAPPHPQSASAAAIVLRQAAAEAITYSDPEAGPGQYLKFHTRADWASYQGTSDQTVTRLPSNIQNVDVYLPSDPGAEWALYRDWEHGQTGDGAFVAETIHAPEGRFYGSPWASQDLSAIPIGSGAETLAYFDAQYQGGSASRDEDDFVRITDLLRTYPVPAPVRARLFEALALIPGTTSTDGVANLDGRVGVAIGRDEPQRSGERQEIIIDPGTGQVIGERRFFPAGAVAAGEEQTVLTAMSVTVVDTAPPATTPARDENG